MIKITLTIKPKNYNPEKELYMVEIEGTIRAIPSEKVSYFMDTNNLEQAFQSFNYLDVKKVEMSFEPYPTEFVIHPKNPD